MNSVGKYTPNEQKLLALLEELGGTPTDSSIIVKRHFARRKAPRFARQSVVSVLNALVIKVQRNRETFRIHKTKRSGPHPIKYWLGEKRNGAA